MQLQLSHGGRFPAQWERHGVKSGMAIESPAVVRLEKPWQPMQRQQMEGEKQSAAHKRKAAVLTVIWRKSNCQKSQKTMLKEEIKMERSEVQDMGSQNLRPEYSFLIFVSVCLYQFKFMSGDFLRVTDVSNTLD